MRTITKNGKRTIYLDQAEWRTIEKASDLLGDLFLYRAAFADCCSELKMLCQCRGDKGEVLLEKMEPPY